MKKILGMLDKSLSVKLPKLSVGIVCADAVVPAILIDLESHTGIIHPFMLVSHEHYPKVVTVQ